eukprot:6192228-Pleurochrysis_carterae.AAC.4
MEPIGSACSTTPRSQPGVCRLVPRSRSMRIDRAGSRQEAQTRLEPTSYGPHTAPRDLSVLGSEGSQTIDCEPVRPDRSAVHRAEAEEQRYWPKACFDSSKQPRYALLLWWKDGSKCFQRRLVPHECFDGKG